VGNLGLLFMLLFFIYAALGVELFGRLECSEDNPCEGLSRHATFSNFGMAFLTLFRVSTGDNWNGIMKDTLRECAREDKHCLTYLPAISPIYFVTFVLVAQFVLVNVVVAVLMKHLEESNKEAREDAELDAELEMEMAQGSPARPRPAAPQSPGASPDSPNVLVVRKVSVSRMLSLPNDSYMFRPVAPAAAAHPHPCSPSAETLSPHDPFPLRAGTEGGQVSLEPVVLHGGQRVSSMGALGCSRPLPHFPTCLALPSPDATTSQDDLTQRAAPIGRLDMLRPLDPQEGRAGQPSGPLVSQYLTAGRAQAIGWAWGKKHWVQSTSAFPPCGN
ncbi:PREDICTED: voltage-dependent T-type calcium channel subunit alpha-1H-like, partial [Bison bison bison]|uniref:Voltage-dependent T-type calcium channel subunit alpha-1H-like n=1 Tax=Bison bison bison TaxID=43346 RepID=A0A6P3H3V3_BISBB